MPAGAPARRDPTGTDPTGAISAGTIPPGAIPTGAIPPETILAAPDYAEFRERLAASGCRRCALAEGRTRIVVDRGNPEAPILCVGEAPGAQEDATGRAFVGRAGRMLDALFASVGLSTDDQVLIVNVVKCRPPGNRAPTVAEAAACRPYLDRQLSLSPARIVALLGATALRRFDPARAKHPLSETVGEFFTLPDHPGREFLTLYHPAALLYNRTLEPKARRHARTLAARAGLADPAPQSKRTPNSPPSSRASVKRTSMK